MTAYSYDDWNSLTQDEQSRNHGISIPRSHPANNPNRLVYTPGVKAASALAKHIQATLTGEDREAAQRMFRQLKALNSRAVESPNAVKRAMEPRQIDGHRALGSTSFSLDDEQLEQLQSAMDDVYTLQKHAEAAGLDPLEVSRLMISRAAADAVGFEPNNFATRPELQEFMRDRAVATTVGNLHQSVGQLYSLVRTGEIDALDVIERERSERELDDRGSELEFLKDIVLSVPLIRDPIDIDPEKNFSVRMDTKEEANTMETIVRWAGQHQELPNERDVHRAFTSWRDSGLIVSPFRENEATSLGLVVNASAGTTSLVEQIAGDSDPEMNLIILTSGNDRLANAGQIAGRNVVAAEIEAGQNGVEIANLNKVDKGSVIVINLSQEQANDPIERSLAANAFVGSSASIGHLGGSNMSVLEAQAIHIAGTSRKLNMAATGNGQALDSEGLRDLREKARNIDRDADANRYFTAGQARPFQGVAAVAFEASRNFDAANRKFAPNEDIMGKMYGRIPHQSVILTSDNRNNATYRYLSEMDGKGQLNRPILYAEATRKLSFARMHDAGLEGQTIMSREATTEFAIYDRPASEREYRMEGEGPGARRVCVTPEIDWNDPRVKGAVILVSGNAQGSAQNSVAQATKVGQEGIMNLAHSAIILNDIKEKDGQTQGSDFHAARMIELAASMGVETTVVNELGKEVPLQHARDLTRRFAQNLTEINDIVIDKRLHGQAESINMSPDDRRSFEQDRRNSSYALGEDIGQMTLAALPGMNADKASKLAHLDLTLHEIRTDNSKEMQQALYKAGMPSDTVKRLHDQQAWLSTTETAIQNAVAADKLGAVYHPANEIEAFPAGKAGFTIGEKPEMPVAAFIGTAMMSYDGASKSQVDPAEVVNREELRRSIQEMTAKGYAIGTTLEEGVPRAILEEAGNVPDAKIVVATSGNPMAASPELRMALIKTIEQGQSFITMPDHIAATSVSAGKDSALYIDKYAENRADMYANLAHNATVGVVVATSDNDQSMHIVDQINKLDKPIAAMIPQDIEQAKQDLYSGNLKLLRGANRAQIESLSLATATSAQGYAEIKDEDTKVSLVDGVMRGNAGTFTSARLARNDMMTSGHHYREMGWGQAAQAISTPASVGRFADAALEGRIEPLGQFKPMTAREMEQRSIARSEITNSEVHEEFRSHSKVYSQQIHAEAGMSLGR